MPQDDVRPHAGPRALQGVPVGVVAEHRGRMARDVVADLPQCRVPRRPGKHPLQHLRLGNKWEINIVVDRPMAGGIVRDSWFAVTHQRLQHHAKPALLHAASPCKARQLCLSGLENFAVHLTAADVVPLLGVSGLVKLVLPARHQRVARPDELRQRPPALRVQVCIHSTQPQHHLPNDRNFRNLSPASRLATSDFSNMRA